MKYYPLEKESRTIETYAVEAGCTKEEAADLIEFLKSLTDKAVEEAQRWAREAFCIDLSRSECSAHNRQIDEALGEYLAIYDAVAKEYNRAPTEKLYKVIVDICLKAIMPREYIVEVVECLRRTATNAEEDAREWAKQAFRSYWAQPKPSAQNSRIEEALSKYSTIYTSVAKESAGEPS